MKVLSFDLGKNIGVVVIDFSQTPFTHKIIMEKLPRIIGARYQRLLDILCDERPDAIMYECVSHHIGTTAAHQFGAYEGILQMYAFRSGCKLCPVYVQRAKSVSGLKNASKKEIEQYIKRVYCEIIPEDADHNVCDAMLVCVAGVSEYLGSEFAEKLFSKA